MAPQADRPENLIETPGGLSRRTLIGRGVMAGLSVSGLSALAACGGDTASTTSTAATTAGAKLGGSGVGDRAIAAAKALPKTEITLVHPSGNAANFVPFYDEWNKLTGQKVKDFEIPIGQLVDKVFAGATAKTSDWDVVVIQPRLFGDLLGAKALTDLTPFVEKHKPDIDDDEHGFLKPQNGYATSYGSKVYGLDADADNFVYLYRKDLFEDPKEQEAFKAKYGRDLAPAATWRDFNDISTFFTRSDKKLWGSAELVSKGWGFWWWELRYASQAAPNAYYFDDDMTPMCNSPEGVNALKLLVELRENQPKDVPGWDFTQTYALFAKGQAAQSTAFGSLAKFCNSGETSQVVGKFTNAPMPGTELDGEVNSRSIFAFGNSMTVWAHSKNAEAAYLFSQWITSPEMSAKMGAQPGFSEPYRLGDAKDPQIQKIYTPELMATWNDIGNTTVPEIMLTGANEYGAALDRQVNAAYVGSVQPEAAMESVAKDWDKITNRLGKQSQQEAWQFLKNSYPKA